MLPGQGDNLLLSPSVVEQRIDMDQQRIGMLLHGPIECPLYLRFPPAPFLPRPSARRPARMLGAPAVRLCRKCMAFAQLPGWRG
jgi:hypothetical protein